MDVFWYMHGMKVIVIFTKRLNLFHLSQCATSHKILHETENQVKYQDYCLIFILWPYYQENDIPEHTSSSAL